MEMKKKGFSFRKKGDNDKKEKKTTTNK